MISKEMHKTLIRFKIGPSAADVFSSVAAQTDRRPPTRVLKDHSYLFHPGQKLGEVQSRGLSYVKYHLSFLRKNENLIPPPFLMVGGLQFHSTYSMLYISITVTRPTISRPRNRPIRHRYMSTPHTPTPRLFG